MRCRQRVRLSEEGARRGPSGGGQPAPDRRGARAPQARERAAAQGERDPFKSERLLREQGAVKKAKFEFIAVFSTRYAVTVLCSALGVTRQGYYAYRKRTPSARDRRGGRAGPRDRPRVRGQPGHIRLAQGLPRAAPRGRAHVSKARGAHHARERVARRHQENARRPSGERRVARSAGAPRPRAARLLHRRPQRGVVRRHHLRAHPPGLAVPGGGDGRVVEEDSRLVHGAENGRGAGRRRSEDGNRQAQPPPAGCVHHSDHGAQYMSLLLGATMRRHRIRPSMGSVASPWDNAATESLMVIVKSECVHARTFATRNEAAAEMFEYIECFYHPLRARVDKPRRVRAGAHEESRLRVA